MKTIFFTIITFLLSANIYAAEPLKYSNEITTDSGKQLEKIIFFKGSNNPNKRLVNNYDHQGNLTERTTYNWVAFQGWVPATKLEYSYNGLNEMTSVTRLSWNQMKKGWNDKKIEIAYYKTTGSDSIFLVEKSK